MIELLGNAGVEVIETSPNTPILLAKKADSNLLR